MKAISLDDPQEIVFLNYEYLTEASKVNELIKYQNIGIFRFFKAQCL